MLEFLSKIKKKNFFETFLTSMHITDVMWPSEKNIIKKVQKWMCKKGYLWDVGELIVLISHPHF